MPKAKTKEMIKKEMDERVGELIKDVAKREDFFKMLEDKQKQKRLDANNNLRPKYMEKN